MTIEALEAEVQATPEKFTPWLRIYLAEGMAEAAI
jgi:isopentenyldiphosphate isomerase